MTLQRPNRDDGYYSGQDFIYQAGGDKEPLLLDMWMAPRTRIPALHAHPHQSEHFHVLSGQFDVKVGRSVRHLEAGQSILIEPDVMHGVGNLSEDAAFVYTEITPGLRTQSFFEELREMEALDLGPVATIVYYGRLVRRYRREYRYSAPVTALFWASAALSWLVPRDTHKKGDTSEGGA